ncbi:hypothetical protein PV11_05229 [Exophiala sideris]|uniref:Chromatin modification-related protein n=1 Tax=Exophiala sideris TaxID=1016849 RepID=A0A0D1YPJ8_9EURO|nr:hypothetical protein PV11_05229 [Exophiala sideris]
MSTATMTTTLGTSNVRGGSSGRRVNPGRTSKTAGSSLRQNSLVSNSGLPLTSSSALTGANHQIIPSNEPLGMYPAITHFADAIAALPREFRRHNSLLKEADAKAWALEESLQKILQQCVADTRTTTYDTIPAQSMVGGEDAVNNSEVHSVAGASFDNASLASALSADPASAQRRQQYYNLRQNLMSIMVTMDEKNHVINTANEEVARHIRRMDRVWPHIGDELSEEARLGSLKHWAYTDINPVKKPTAPTTRREAAAATLAVMGEGNEVSHRSEARREAILARRQRTGQHADSDFDESRSVARKANSANKKRVTEQVPEPPGLGISTAGAGKRKKPEKLAIGGVGMERSISSAMGGRAMSRENSQQESKKRKASVAPTTVARKRLNASALDSPKLVSSPLAGTAGKEAYKRSPALSSVRPAMGRGRQNSTQKVDTARERQSSIASSKNGNNQNITASTAEVNSVAALTGKTANEVRNTMKETRTDKGDRLIEDEPAALNGSNGEFPLRGALLLERSASRQSGKGEVGLLEDLSMTKAAPSPRLTPALQALEYKHERVGRGRASNTSTPIVTTFAEAEESEGASTNGNPGKAKRPARPRVKDHGLHDSLSPKGLPMKRSHKKNGSIISVFPPIPGPPSQGDRRPKDENNELAGTPELVGPGRPGDEEEEGEDEDQADDEERYCYCQGVSYGEMVACDKDDCPRQWFHLECIGLKSVPKSAKWYCDECKEALARKGTGKVGNGGNGNGSGSVSASGNGSGK